MFTVIVQCKNAHINVLCGTLFVQMITNGGKFKKNEKSTCK